MSRKKILVVDDEEKIVHIVRAYLEREDYVVITASDGEAAIDMTRRQNPDLIVLDLMLPEISGWDVCRKLRRESNIPIIMLTARDEDTDKIVGLELGADDYVTKPFNPKELVSRIRAVLRRSEDGLKEKSKAIHIADLTIDVDRRHVQRGDEVIELTATEFEILRILAENPGRIYSRIQLLDRVQGDAYEGYERVMDSHIKNLRRKIEHDRNRPQYIITVHSVGYKFVEDRYD